MQLITDYKDSSGGANKKFKEFLTNPVPVTEMTASETDDLYKVLVNALEKHKGMGISANQLGLKKRACLVRVGENEFYFINPVIIDKSVDKFVFHESCLSIPKSIRKPIPVTRHTKVVVKSDNLGETTFEWNRANDTDTEVSAETMLTSVVQHEVDHLDGITIRDRQISKTITKTNQFGRNDKVMMRSPEGDIVDVKFKKANEYFVKGYEIL